MAPCTVLHENPSMELSVSAMSLALSASEARVALFSSWKLAYDSSPGRGGFTTTSMHVCKWKHEVRSALWSKYAT